MKIMLSPSPSASLLLLLMSSITPPCCLPPAPQTPLPGPEKADPDHVPFPSLILSISLLLTPHSPSSERHLSSPHLQVTTTWAGYSDYISYIDVIHLSLLFVRLCSSVSASTVSNCLPVSVRCFSVWIHCLFLLWENSPYLTLQNTDATKHYQFTPRQSQWDFAFVAPPESSCILGRLQWRSYFYLLFLGW